MDLSACSTAIYRISSLTTKQLTKDKNLHIICVHKNVRFCVRRKDVNQMIATRPLDLRSNLKKYMDVAFHGEPVIISRPKNENVVMLSEEDYNNLIKTRKNAEYLARLDRSFEQLANNHTISFSLNELRDMESDNWNPTQKIKDFMEHMENE